MVLFKLLITGVLTATGIYYLGIYLKGGMCHLKDRIDGKIVLITGANTGIGLETAVELARRGGIIHMACKNAKRCKDAQDIVISRSFVNHHKVLIHILDLASIKSILSFTKEFKTSVDKLDILINNAGIMKCPYLETEDGFEMQIGVNHLGHFLLTNELLDIIKKGIDPRILIVSSQAHERGSINKTNINLRGDAYDRMAAYEQSKLANVIHANYLAKDLKKDRVTVVSLHPGVVHTELRRHVPITNYREKLWAFLMSYLRRTPLKGAQTSICCAVDPNLHKHTGKYFEDCEPWLSLNPESSDEAIVNLLWKQSSELVDSKVKKIKLDV